MALRFLLLPLLRSWHSLLGELESIESNRESEEKTGTPLGSCRPINIIHKGNIFPPKDHSYSDVERDTQGDMKSLLSVPF